MSVDEAEQLYVQLCDRANDHHTLMVLYAPWCTHCQGIEKEVSKEAAEGHAPLPAPACHPHTRGPPPIHPPTPLPLSLPRNHTSTQAERDKTAATPDVRVRCMCAAARRWSGWRRALPTCRRCASWPSTPTRPRGACLRARCWAWPTTRPSRQCRRTAGPTTSTPVPSATRRWGGVVFPRGQASWWR